MTPNHTLHLHIPSMCFNNLPDYLIYPTYLFTMRFSYDRSMSYLYNILFLLLSWAIFLFMSWHKLSFGFWNKSYCFYICKYGVD